MDDYLHFYYVDNSKIMLKTLLLVSTGLMKIHLINFSSACIENDYERHWIMCDVIYLYVTCSFKA